MENSRLGASRFLLESVLSLASKTDEANTKGVTLQLNELAPAG